MGVITLIETAEAQGLQLRLVDGEVKVSGPKDAPIVPALRAHKAELTEFLKTHSLSGACALCSKPDTGIRALVVPLAERAALWLHADCYPQWLDRTGASRTIEDPAS